MKTKESIKKSTDISQSEALLSTIHGGFFEVYLDKSKIRKLLSGTTGEVIRLKLEGWKNGRWAFVAEAVNRFGKKSATRVDFAVVSKQNNTTFQHFWKNFKAEFNSGDLARLLSPAYCVGLRLMPSTSNNTRKQLIAVGVQPGGFDIAEGAGYICGKMA